MTGSSRHVIPIALFMSLCTLYLGAQYTPRRRSGYMNQQPQPASVDHPIEYNQSKFRPIDIPRYSQVKSERLEEPVRYTFNTSAENVGHMGLTCAIKSRLYSKTPGKIIRVGEFFSLFVEACDENGRHRVKGGDFWMTALRSTSAHSAGKVIDYGNGTYEVIFFAAWEGVVSPVVTLVHTYEATYFLEKILMPIEKRITWHGVYKVGKVTETGMCMVEGLGSWTNKCEYPQSNALGGTVFVCDKPPTLPCNSLVSIKSSSASVQEFFAAVDDKDKALFARTVLYVNIPFGPKTILINPSDKYWFHEHTTVMDHVRLPECQGRLGNSLNDGYWNTSMWNSLTCNTKQWTKQEIMKCVHGKHLVLLGDSTTRQWGDGILALLGLKQKHSRYQINARNEILNMTFQFHPYWIASVAEPRTGTEFEVNIIDSLVGCDYYVMVSPWAHYTQWTMDTYLDRLNFIKLSLIRFKKRCPVTPIVIKSPHPREHPTLASVMYGSDYLLHVIRHVLRDFADELDVYFLDAWDMNWSHPSKKNIHMPMPVIYQELYMFFSSVCQ